MEQVNKGKEEREKLLDKIKQSIGKEKNKQKPTPELIKNNNDQEVDRDVIVESAKSNIDFEKVKKSNSLFELFDDELLIKNDRKRNQIRTKRIRGNVDLGNVYS